MKSVYLVMHQQKPEVETLVRQVVDAFQRVGIAVQAEPWLYTRMGKAAQALFAENWDDVEAVVSVGGDGTLLRANQYAITQNVPILGINVGHIGFLAEVEFDQLTAACESLQKGEYTLESRMMLQAEIEDGPTLVALNDIVVSRGGYARLIAVKAWVDQELAGRYIADGLIVSTPTGSTGYSLSAGGPIVCPDVDCIILSPICAHSLQHRPVVISAKQKIRLELDCEPTQQAQLSADGLEPVSLQGNQRVRIVCAPKKAQFIRFNETQGFFSLIRYKLSKWSC